MRGLTGRLVLVAAVLCFAPDARAHLGHVVVRAERYIKVEVGSDQARVVISMTMGAAEMAQVLAAADAEGDRDGTVTDAEAEAYLQTWGEGLQEELPIEVDGREVAADWGEGYLTPLGPVRPAPGAVEMTARIPLDGGRYGITVRDRMRPEVADRTDVAFRVLDGVELIASGVGESPEGVARDLAYGPRLAAAGKTEALTAIVSVPGLPRPARLAFLFGGPAAVLLAAAAWLSLRRRHKSRTPPDPTPSPR
ncbi:MAG: hypothetical protein ACOC9O_00080 [Myxococcota bacterium]